MSSWWRKIAESLGDTAGGSGSWKRRVSRILGTGTGPGPWPRIILSQTGQQQTGASWARRLTPTGTLVGQSWPRRLYLSGGPTPSGAILTRDGSTIHTRDGSTVVART